MADLSGINGNDQFLKGITGRPVDMSLDPQKNTIQTEGSAGKLDGSEKTDADKKEHKHNVKPGYKSSPEECQTCKTRMYQDGSDEGNVSFKAPGHISPQASFGAVMGHEMEHVGNAIAEGSQPGAKLLSATVSLQVAICPECGTAYVSGGETRTTISYSSNPYDQGRKTIEGSFLAGNNLDGDA
ncbi:MAG: hypothetical protein VZR00_01805 [Lachnospiraceae bacterium]|jgi:hypothetical protein|nr:hypothetical protein [Lachnospiraceae bacterium]MEE3460610.1 hypothetical protein [Lachnospiraceae bacterium]